MDYYEELQRIIPVGRENAIHLNELAQALGVHGGKAKQIIQTARREHRMDICSGVQGYWFPVDDNERQEYYRTLHKHAISCLVTLKPMGDTLKAFKGQINITDVLDNQSNYGGGDIEQ